jgi:guanyl-specific ribonuclease Sa
VALLALVIALAVGYGIRALNRDDSSNPRPGGSSSASSTSVPTATGAVALSSLPNQVITTVHLIERGGPFPYPRNDGAVFHNNEHQLPRARDGYYHEYTVPTPGSSDRGARRIITGVQGQYWYTDDHYASFERVDVSR